MTLGSNTDPDESDNEDPPEVPPHNSTIKEAEAAVQILQSFFEGCENVGNSVFSTLVNVENFVNSNSDAQMKQSSTDDYFSRTPTASNGQ